MSGYMSMDCPETNRIFFVKFALSTRVSMLTMIHCVILLHGLGRSSYSMSAIAQALSRDDYVVVNYSYPSRQKSIEVLAEEVVGKNIAECRQAGATRIDFVTHTMGGILVRQYLQSHTVPEIKRIVMLGPPNHGSEISSRYRQQYWYRWFTGQAGQQLHAGADSLPNQLKPLSGVEIGIIAGSKSADPWFSAHLPAPHNGNVSVASIQLPEMQDFMILPYTHTFMMRSDVVIAQIRTFLKQGAFAHTPV